MVTERNAGRSLQPDIDIHLVFIDETSASNAEIRIAIGAAGGMMVLWIC